MWGAIAINRTKYRRKQPDFKTAGVMTASVPVAHACARNRNRNRDYVQAADSGADRQPHLRQSVMRGGLERNGPAPSGH